MPESFLQKSPGIASRLPDFRQLHRTLENRKEQRTRDSEQPSKFINARILKDDMRGYTKMCCHDDARVSYRMLCREQMRRVLERLFSIIEHCTGSAGEEKLG